MKSFLLTFLFLLCYVGVSAYTPLPAELDGTMMPYTFSETDSVTPWEGTKMRPIGTAYIARHGARYLSSERKVSSLLKAISESRENGCLTAEGEEFALLLDTVVNLSRGHWGDLSIVGSDEEQRLGSSYCESLPDLALKLKGDAVSSYVPRVVRTMWDFLYPLAANSPDNELTSAEGPQFSTLVRFFETDTSYRAYIKNGDWKEVYERYLTEHIPDAPARRLFGNISNESGLRNLTLDIYGVLQSLRAINLSAPTTRWMSVGEYRSCWEVSNLQHYLQRSLCSISNDAMRAATPLLQDIIAKTDSIVNGTSAINANFWFGHAETLLPLMALMDLPGCTALPLDWTDLASIWKDYKITPLGANILIVLMEEPDSDNIHAAVRLNGRWIEPLKGEGQIPLWRDLRDLWIQRISAFNPMFH